MHTSGTIIRSFCTDVRKGEKFVESIGFPQAALMINLSGQLMGLGFVSTEAMWHIRLPLPVDRQRQYVAIRVNCEGPCRHREYVPKDHRRHERNDRDRERVEADDVLDVPGEPSPE